MCRLVKAVNVLFSAPTERRAAERTPKDEGIKGEGEMEGEDGKRQGEGGFHGEWGGRPVWLEDIDFVST